MFQKSKLIMIFFLVTAFLSNPAFDVFAGFSKELLKVQKQLKYLGYNPGPIDGIWGQKTLIALKHFQKDNNLVVNGKIDENTRNLLLNKKALNRIKNSISNSENDYKGACINIPVSELTKNTNKFKGKFVKYTGKIVIMEFATTQKSGQRSPNRIVLSVEDNDKTLTSGLLPIFIVYHGETDSFINDYITIYGKVFGEYKYKNTNMGIQEKLLPRIDAKYLVKE